LHLLVRGSAEIRHREQQPFSIGVELGWLHLERDQALHLECVELSPIPCELLWSIDLRADVRIGRGRARRGTVD
jgi:hypothetical protein